MSAGPTHAGAQTPLSRSVSCCQNAIHAPQPLRELDLLPGCAEQHAEFGMADSGNGDGALNRGWGQALGLGRESPEAFGGTFERLRRTEQVRPEIADFFDAGLH